MLIPFLTDFLNHKGMAAGAVLTFLAIVAVPHAQAIEPLTNPGFDQPQPEQGGFDPLRHNQQMEGASIGGFIGDGGGVRFNPEGSDPAYKPVNDSSKPVEGEKQPDKYRQGIPPTERGFQGEADFTPREKYPQRVHNNDRMNRSIDHLEQTENFRKETLDKMRRAIQQQQAPTEAAQKRAQVLQLQKSYDRAMADLDRQKKQLRAEYKAQLNALKEDSMAKPALQRGSQSIGGGSARGGGMGRDNNPNIQMK